MDYLDYTELRHHGIEGMKWGIRRYQNEDGSLTAAGRERYGVNAKGKMSKAGKRQYKNDKFIDKEISFQRQQISSYRTQAQNTRQTIDDMKRTGKQKLIDAGYDDQTADEALKETVKRHSQIAASYDFIADKLVDYNTKISDLDTSSMNRAEIEMYCRGLGDKTQTEINAYLEELNKT